MRKSRVMQKPYLRSLFVWVYFLVISIIPLSNLHIESQLEMNYVLAGNADAHGPCFLDVLHELLFSHFGNNSEHMGKSLSVAEGPKIGRARAAEHGVSSDYCTSGDPVLFSRPDGIFALVLEEQPVPCDGPHTCFSGLSPPSHFIS